MKNFLHLLMISAIAVLFFSCSTTKELSAGLTAPQLLQEGQTALDGGEYKFAEKCFLQAINQYGDNTDIYIESKYELAHLYVKTKDYDKAYVILTELQEIYSHSYSLPPAYRKLIQIEMDKIPENKHPSDE